MAKVDLNVIKNVECEMKCSKNERKDKSIDDLCVQALSVIDKRPVRCVGDWAMEKIHYLVQYFAIFSMGMKKKWNGLNYIEICSGPGRCINRETGDEFDGTALAIVKHDNIKYINRALFFDFNEDVTINLNKRFTDLNAMNAKAYYGNYNDSDSICDILKTQIPSDNLNLVFIDPTDCSLPFDLIKSIKQSLKYVDFIINIASGTDFNRNVVGVFEKPDRYQSSYDKYTRFLGNSSFFEDPQVKEWAKYKDHQDLRIKFREYYEESLKNIGYNHFAYKPIKHYYDLIFATANPTGKTFWEKVNKIEYDGQRELF